MRGVCRSVPLLLAITACRDTAGPTTGVLYVVLQSVGGDIDPDGYFLSLDGSGLRVSVNSETKLTPASGDHELVVDDIAPNCDPDGPTTRHLVIHDADSTHVSLTMHCFATGIEVSTVTAGKDIPVPGYTGVLTPVVCEQGGSCTSTGNQTFWQVGSTATTLLTRLAAGDYEIALDQPKNCVPQAPSAPSRSVWTVANRAVVPVHFDFECRRLILAFNRGPGLMVTDGSPDSEFSLGVSGTGPAWSPDGARIAYSGFTCDENDDCTPGRLYTASVVDRGDVVALSSETQTADPTWRPDGARIAFTTGPIGARQIHIMNADGSGTTALSLPVIDAAQLSWSPDGTRIAFTCEVDAGNTDVCTVNPDGSGFVRVTSQIGIDAEPSWSPGGTQLVYTTDLLSVVPATNIAIMQSDGSSVVSISTGRHPAWSPDGSRIAFEKMTCSATECTADGFYLMAPDGSGLTRLAAGSAAEPAWRP
ncbi:MAG TPA: hypothetical protein VF981_07465 [Gemmatimonadaceae bacterium]